MGTYKDKSQQEIFNAAIQHAQYKPDSATGKAMVKIAMELMGN